jgi:Copper transport outer membrane protein, MctB
VFDLRYHVASLAAVFVALIIGILVGVGLSGSGVTKDADLKVARSERDDARAQAQAYKQQLDQAGDEATAFTLAYPVVMRGLLTGKRIAVLFVGPTDARVNAAIDTTLADAGAQPAVRTLSLKVPVDVTPSSRRRRPRSRVSPAPMRSRHSAPRSRRSSSPGGRRRSGKSSAGSS